MFATRTERNAQPYAHVTRRTRGSLARTVTIGRAAVGAEVRERENGVTTYAGVIQGITLAARGAFTEGGLLALGTAIGLKPVWAMGATGWKAIGTIYNVRVTDDGRTVGDLHVIDTAAGHALLFLAATDPQDVRMEYRCSGLTETPVLLRARLTGHVDIIGCIRIFNAADERQEAERYASAVTEAIY